MAYAASGLSLLGSVGGNNTFLYRSADSLAVQTAANYFLPSFGQFNLGDIIFLNSTVTNNAMDEVRVTAVSATGVTVTGRRLLSQSIGLPVTAVASTALTMVLPPCTIVRATSITTTAYTGATVTNQLGTTAAGVDIVAAATIKAQGLVAHTVLTTGAKFAGGTLFVTVAQTTPTAVGTALLTVEYIAD